MGIPLLHPWANRLSGFEYRAAGKTVTLSREDPRIPQDPAGLPIHGVLPGLLHWDVEDTVAADVIVARLRWGSEDLLALSRSPTSSCPCERRQRRAEIATNPGGGDARPRPGLVWLSALHSCSRRRRDAWRLKLDAFKRLLLDDRMIPTGERAPVNRRSLRLAEASFDDAFDALAVPAEFEAVGGAAAVTVKFLAGYSYAQGYAPASQNFVRFEPMTAPTNALNSGDGLRLVQPGEPHRAAFRITPSTEAQ